MFLTATPDYRREHALEIIRGYRGVVVEFERTGHQPDLYQDHRMLASCLAHDLADSDSVPRLTINELLRRGSRLERKEDRLEARESQ